MESLITRGKWKKSMMKVPLKTRHAVWVTLIVLVLPEPSETYRGQAAHLKSTWQNLSLWPGVRLCIGLTETAQRADSLSPEGSASCNTNFSDHAKHVITQITAVSPEPLSWTLAQQPRNVWSTLGQHIFPRHFCSWLDWCLLCTNLTLETMLRRKERSMEEESGINEQRRLRKIRIIYILETSGWNHAMLTQVAMARNLMIAFKLPRWQRISVIRADAVARAPKASV